MRPQVSERQFEAAALALRAGQLVVIPTETVYGLACNALNPAAVEKVFRAKGRPSENPLIVHVANGYDFSRLCEWSDLADELTIRFWPGPLTVVLPKKPSVPDITTAGQPTVALRMPRSVVALRLIEAVGSPLAAPSANRFGELSPTRAEHVSAEIAQAARVLLDEGPCEVGIESTIVAIEGDRARLLRPGVLDEELKPWLTTEGGSHIRAPGSYSRHYAPKAEVILCAEVPHDAAGLVFEKRGPNQIQMPAEPAGYARELYRALHEIDLAGHAKVYIQLPPSTDIWMAVIDRLRRAAG